MLHDHRHAQRKGKYAGAWDDADCTAHHQGIRRHHVHFAADLEKRVTISLSAGALHVSKGPPQNVWGPTPVAGYEHRKNARHNNGKLVHDGNTVTLTLDADETYTAEAAGNSSNFTTCIAPQ